MKSRATLARSILTRAAHVEQLRTMQRELRAMGHASLSFALLPAIRYEHGMIALAAQRLGLPTITLTADAVASARTVLGIAPDGSADPSRRPTPAAWRRDLAAAEQSA